MVVLMCREVSACGPGQDGYIRLAICDKGKSAKGNEQTCGGRWGGFGRSMLLRPAGGLGLRMSRSRPGVDVLAGPLLSGSVELR
jgi:hypothetical protein